jgi:hypothetical protein
MPKLTSPTLDLIERAASDADGHVRRTAVRAVAEFRPDLARS